MKKLLYFILLLTIFIPILSTADASSSGFISGQIWYSKGEIKEGDNIKIYTGLWNNNQFAMSVKVEFYDKNVVLGSRSVVVPSLQLKEVYIPWKVTSGEHLISAKIIPPTTLSNSKKEIITLDFDNISADRIFVPVTIKNTKEDSDSNSDSIKNQIDKAASSLQNVIPSSVSNSVGEQISNLDDFRLETLDKITSNKTEVEKEIDQIKKLEEKVINNESDKDNGSVIAQTKSAVSDGTQKPIAYIKLFLLSCLYFIFGSKTVFYLAITVLVLLVIRFIYRKIKNK